MPTEELLSWAALQHRELTAIRRAAIGDQNPARFEHVSTVDIVTALREQVDAAGFQTRVGG